MRLIKPQMNRKLLTIRHQEQLMEIAVSTLLSSASLTLKLNQFHLIPCVELRAAQNQPSPFVTTAEAWDASISQAAIGTSARCTFKYLNTRMREAKRLIKASIADKFNAEETSICSSGRESYLCSYLSFCPF